MTRINISEPKKLVEEKDGQLLDNQMVKGRRMLTVKCNKCGHLWTAPMYNIKKGKWCKKCFDAGHIISRKDIEKLVKLKGYELLTDGELTRKSKLNVRCPTHDFVWQSAYTNFKYSESEGTCRFCAHGAPKIKEVSDFAEDNNGKLIKRDPENNSKYIIVCNKHNHKWSTDWHTLQKGSWCYHCGIDKYKTSYNQIKELVESKNGILLSDNCSSATEKFMVKCGKDVCNYKWETTWTRIQSGCWCPKCAKQQRYTEEEIRFSIELRGGKLISAYPGNVTDKITVKCKCGNTFHMPTHRIIIRGSWCSVCSGRLKTQSYLYDILKNIFQGHSFYFNYRGFEWLRYRKDSKSTMEIDIFIHNKDKSFTLAVEYDGEHHFKPVKFASTMTDKQAIFVHKDQKKRDARKNKLIPEHPDEIKHFIRFNYMDSINERDVRTKLKDAGII